MPLFNFLKKKEKPPGQWVPEIEYGNYGRTYETGKYVWEGPEPKGGRPPNPSETPEAIAKRKANNNKRKANNEAAMLRMNARIKQAAKNAEEKAEEDKACQNAINTVRAKRSNATKRNRRGSRKTRKN